MSSRVWMLRLAALLAAGTFGVHQARYALGYHDHAGEALASQGHAYLGPLATLIAAALILAFAELLRRAAHGRPSLGAAPRLTRLWAGSTCALLAVYAAQELVEGALSAHHPPGLAALSGHGGWVVLPLALAVGLVIALVMRAAGELPVARRPWRAPAPAVPLRHALGARLAAAPQIAPGAAVARGPPLPCA